MKKLTFLLVVALAALAVILTMYMDKRKDYTVNATQLLQNEGIEVKSVKINRYLPDGVYTATYNGTCRIIVKRGQPTSAILDDTCGE